MHRLKCSKLIQYIPYSDPFTSCRCSGWLIWSSISGTTCRGPLSDETDCLSLERHNYSNNLYRNTVCLTIIKQVVAWFVICVLEQHYQDMRSKTFDEFLSEASRGCNYHEAMMALRDSSTSPAVSLCWGSSTSSFRIRHTVFSDTRPSLWGRAQTGKYIFNK